MHQTLSPLFEQRLRAILPERPRAADVLALSDFYLAHPGTPTPWKEAFAAPAYLSYFLPLNYARVRAVWREVRRFLPDQSVRAIVDYGSGTGTVQWAIEDDEDFAARDFYCVERSREAMALHQRLLDVTPARFGPRFRAPSAIADGTLGIFSYAFLEMQAHLPDLTKFDHFLIIEPSTRECGRQLMQWRQRLLDLGFDALAPCTHARACPLLVESARDWCHMRIGFDAPEWWRAIEDDLPMTNRTLTYSYLLMSRTVADTAWRDQARVIGDTLRERGKIRQMICRGPRREFLSWLLKNGEPAGIPHGALVRGADRAETKGGGEVRIGPEVALEVTK